MTELLYAEKDSQITNTTFLILGAMGSFGFGFITLENLNSFGYQGIR